MLHNLDAENFVMREIKWSRPTLGWEILFLTLVVSGCSYWLPSLGESTLSAFLLLISGTLGILWNSSRLKITNSVLLISLIVVFGLIHATEYSNSAISQSKLWLCILMFVLGKIWGIRPSLVGNLSISTIGILALVSMITGIEFSNGWEGTMCSVFPHRNVFVFVMIPCFWWLVHALIQGENGRWKNLFRVNLVLVTFLLVFSDSRAGILAWCISGILFSILYFQKLKWKVLAISVIILCVLLGRIGTEGGQRSLVKEPIAALQGKPGLVSGGGTSSSGRIQYWKATIESWKNNPLWGNGEGSVRYGLETYRLPSESARLNVMAVSSHNHYLEILHDRGILGLALELALLIWAMVAVFKNREWALFACLIALSMQSFVAAESEFPVSVSLWWWCIGHSLRHEQVGYTIRPALAKLVYGLVALLSLVTIYRQSVALRSDIYAGKAYLNEVRFSEYLEKSGKIDPKNMNYLYVTAASYMNFGQYDDAKKTVGIMKELSPGFKRVDHVEAGYLRAIGKIDSSIAILENLARLYPNDPEVIENLIVSWNVKGGVVALQKKKELMVRYRKIYVNYAKDLRTPYLNRHALPIWVPKSTRNKWEQSEKEGIRVECQRMAEAYLRFVK